MLVAQNLHKYYGQLHVLKGIDLHIETGKITTIVGPSGAGKSTLLHILGTLDKPDKGSLTAEGINLLTLNEKELARFRNLTIGFVFQFHNLLPEFTALENIAMPGYIAGKSTDELHQRAIMLAEKLGVAHRLSHKPAELSGGEQQRIAVARALINSPTIVFADEPTGNLDTRNAEELHNLFFKLRDELNQTFVIVTHNEALANATDRKITIIDGRIADDSKQG
ncbi:MAG: ABC transporter ATP-binding protein [Cytophagales bacterium]|nr:ABC transporter ATP-binding protein [Bernardetiaceae bacterium]MDW8205175.1 ABC transporter ATP-binding protein [Cytophagales bacterium]